METSTETTATTATPQAGETVAVTPTQAVKTTPSAEPQAGEAPESMSLEEAKKLRKEAQALRARLKGYEDIETAAQLAALSEVEKSNKRATDAEARIQQFQQELINERIINAASKKNIIDPEMAALALQGKLEYGEDGMPTNLDKALTDLIKNKPYLLAQAQTETPAPTTPATSAPTPNAPATPPSNPGRSSIVSPLATPSSNGKYVAPTWNSIYNKS